MGAAEKDGVVTVDRQAVRVERRTFDPANPTKDAPKLEANEAAVTESGFGISAEFKVLILEEAGRRSQVKVTSAHVTTNLNITIWLPEGAGKQLAEHEEAHR